MTVTKFEGLNRGLIKVELENRSIVLTGELTIDKFYADKISMSQWEPPFEKEVITEDEKKEIIKAIEEYSKKGKIRVVFD